MSGTNKSEIAEEISKILKCEHINQNNFLDINFGEIIEIENKKIKIWDSDEAIKWDSFNEKINEKINEKNIIVISGISFNKDKINFKNDYHLHLKLSKQILLEKRNDFIERHSQYENIDEDTRKMIFNKYTYPYYLKTTENEVINKFLNINEMNKNEIINQTFNLIMTFIENKIYNNRQDIKWNDENKTYDYL